MYNTISISSLCRDSVRETRERHRGCVLLRAGWGRHRAPAGGYAAEFLGQMGVGPAEVEEFAPQLAPLLRDPSSAVPPLRPTPFSTSA